MKEYLTRPFKEFSILAVLETWLLVLGAPPAAFIYVTSIMPEPKLFYYVINIALFLFISYQGGTVIQAMCNAGQRAVLRRNDGP